MITKQAVFLWIIYYNCLTNFTSLSFLTFCSSSTSGTAICHTFYFQSCRFFDSSWIQPDHGSRTESIHSLLSQWGWHSWSCSSGNMCTAVTCDGASNSSRGRRGECSLVEHAGTLHNCKYWHLGWRRYQNQVSCDWQQHFVCLHSTVTPWSSLTFCFLNRCNKRRIWQCTRDNKTYVWRESERPWWWEEGQQDERQGVQKQGHRSLSPLTCSRTFD